MKYSEFLRQVADKVYTFSQTKDMVKSCPEIFKGNLVPSAYLCNIIAWNNSAHAKRLRKTIRRKLDKKAGYKNTHATFSIFIPNAEFTEERVAQYRKNWLLKLAALHEKKGN